MQLNPIPADLADWTQAPFPVETKTGSDSKVILLGTFGKQVVGFIYWGETPEAAWSVQPIAWQADGAYAGGGRGVHPDMDLPPPPAETEELAAKLRGEIAEIEARLAANPDAPEAWRAGDERVIARLRAQIDKLVPPAPLPEAA